MKKTITLAILSALILLVFANFVQAQSGEDPMAGMKNYEYKNGNWVDKTTGQIAPFSLGTGATPQGNKDAQGSPTTANQASGFPNPLDTDSIEGVLNNIMSYLRGIAGTIAVIFIIIGGIMYMISGGSKEMTERAKKTLICAIAGLAIVLAAPYFGQEIKAIISGSSPGSALQQILMNILKLLLAIVGFLAIISMVVGAIWMLTAVGDEDRYELGKKTAGYSILGLVIALSALIIANQVTNLVGGSSSSSSVINSAANSSVTGASVPSLPTSSGGSSATLGSKTYDLVGINNQTDTYMYKDEQGNFYEKNEKGVLVSGQKNDVVPITQLGTLQRTGNTVFRDTYGDYYEMGGQQPVPLKLQDNDAINYFPSKK